MRRVGRKKVRDNKAAQSALIIAIPFRIGIILAGDLMTPILQLIKQLAFAIIPTTR